MAYRVYNDELGQALTSDLWGAFQTSFSLQTCMQGDLGDIPAPDQFSTFLNAMFLEYDHNEIIAFVGGQMRLKYYFNLWVCRQQIDPVTMIPIPYTINGASSTNRKRIMANWLSQIQGRYIAGANGRRCLIPTFDPSGVDGLEMLKVMPGHAMNNPPENDIFDNPQFNLSIGKILFEVEADSESF